jgi:uncharacterized membrane protein
VSVLRESIEIERAPEDVFAYLDEVERHGEWQDQIVNTRVESEASIGVGTRVRETRKLPGGMHEFVYEVTEHDPPHRSAFRVLDGPVRPFGTVTVESAGRGRSRVTLELDFKGHGAGRMMLPMVRNQARKQIPKDQQRLKERLEAGA